MTSGTRTYFVKLYCRYDLLTSSYRDILEENNHPGSANLETPDWWELREDIEQLIDTCGSSVEYVGSRGSSVSVEVKEKKMPVLLRKVGDYNKRRDLVHIIHTEIY
tara:strand:+ start:253 stop:570 length:318 start_codon:yes stop_codon:yes gene_type:complete